MMGGQSKSYCRHHFVPLVIASYRTEQKCTCGVDDLTLIKEECETKEDNSSICNCRAQYICPYPTCLATI
jgi:hypothetical protein